MATKELKPILRNLEKEGYTISMSGSGHIKVRAPSGQVFTTSSTPSCPHAHKKLLRDIRRYGKVKA